MNIDITTRTKGQFIKILMPILKKEALLIIASLLAIITSFFSLPKIEYIDFKVLVLLFNLMIIVAAFKKQKIFDTLAISVLSKCTSYRSISFTLVFLTFFAAMIITNDVALITFVPLTLIVANKAKISSLKIIIFQTLAANLGSSLTPMGNPQNLFIYSFFNINPLEFFKITLPLVIISSLFLVSLIIRLNKTKLPLKLDIVKIENKKNVLLYSILFAIIILSVFHLVDYRLTLMLTVLMVFILDRELFVKVDYSLLLTFIAFFIFIGNISSIEVVENLMSKLLSSELSTYTSAILTSQVISNVPSAILISPFTDFYPELLLGVNIGGLGTIIASLASVISYKLYIQENPSDGTKYLSKFTFYNIIGLVILVPLIYILLVYYK